MPTPTEDCPPKVNVRLISLKNIKEKKKVKLL
jgi:hypothetical protein